MIHWGDRYLEYSSFARPARRRTPRPFPTTPSLPPRPPPRRFPLVRRSSRTLAGRDMPPPSAAIRNHIAAIPLQPGEVPIAASGAPIPRPGDRRIPVEGRGRTIPVAGVEHPDGPLSRGDSPPAPPPNRRITTRGRRRIRRPHRTGSDGIALSVVQSLSRVAGGVAVDRSALVALVARPAFPFVRTSIPTGSNARDPP